MRLAGTHVLLVGGSRGIGASMVAEATRRGARVTAVARSASALEQVGRDHGAAAFVADLEDPADRIGLLARVEEQHGPVDVLVANAGVDAVATMLEATAEDVARAVTVNLLAPLELVRQALPGMLARGRGHVVLTSSGFSTVAAPALAPYCATKAGLSHFAVALAMELKGTPVEVTVVEPGPVRTEMIGDIERHPVASAAVRRLVALGLTRYSDPEEVARRGFDAVEAGRRHVAVPRRMTPPLALARVPGAVGALVQRGVPRR